MQAGELKERKVQGYGWVPDLPDARDHPYQLPRIGFVAELPRSVNFRSQFSPPYDQEDLGSCTGNAIAGCYQFLRRKQGIEPDWIPSRLFIYYNERKIEHTVRTDSGAMIRNRQARRMSRGLLAIRYGKIHKEAK
jgi:C1A family cysteine protease